MSESESMIAVKPHIAERAHLSSLEEYERLYRLSLDNPDWFWSEQAQALTWFHPFQNVLDVDYEEKLGSPQPGRWFFAGVRATYR